MAYIRVPIDTYILLCNRINGGYLPNNRNGRLYRVPINRFSVSTQRFLRYNPIIPQSPFFVTKVKLTSLQLSFTTSVTLDFTVKPTGNLSYDGNLTSPVSRPRHNPWVVHTFVSIQWTRPTYGQTQEQTSFSEGFSSKLKTLR